MKKSTKGFFDPKTAFFSLSIVKWTIVIGIFLIITVFVFIATSSPREIDTSANGFNEFLEMIKFPTFLLGFFAALLALFATNHRSEQNKAAMNLAESQNRFSNYYKHIEEYASYLKNQFERYPEGVRPIIDIQKLHRCLYPNAKSEGIQLSPIIELRIFDEVHNFIESFTKTDFKSKENLEKLVTQVDLCCKNIYSSLMDSIKLNPIDGAVNFYDGDHKIEIPNARVRAFMLSSLAKIQTINAVLHFEETFKSDLLESLISHTKITINHIPDISIGGGSVIDWHEKPDKPMDKEIDLLHEKLNELRETSNTLLLKIRGS